MEGKHNEESERQKPTDDESECTQDDEGRG